MAIQKWLQSDFNGKLRLNIEADKLALLLILILALVLRLIFFNGLNWDDDPDYVWRAYQVKSGQAFIYKDNNGFRIGTFYPAALMFFIFGINNFACGAYALVVSLLSILAIFLLGKLLFNKTTGLVAALLLAFYPLDVELASRLMPDGLLSGFSLFAIYFLIKGDKKNQEDNAPRLVSKGCYVLSGLLLAWCTLVNMSSFVLIIFLFIYSILSIFYFKDKLTKIGFIRGLFKIFLYRYLILGLSILAVLAAEGLLYKNATGNFIFKYENTILHYSADHGFNKNLWTYPRIMLHIDKSGKFRFQGIENSYYGFYFLFAFFALIYAFIRPNKNILFVSLWLLVLWAYLQWGSMSFSTYTPLHRLPRHLALVTPAMILCLAYFLSSFQPKEVKKYLSSSILTFLLISSLVFTYYRHQVLVDSVRPQKTISSYLYYLNPNVVYASNDTIAYQRFINRYRNMHWEYRDIQMASSNGSDNAYAIIGEHRNWMDTAHLIWKDVQSIPENWKLINTLEIPGAINRPNYDIRIFKLLVEPIQKLKSQQYKYLKEMLMSKYSNIVNEKTRIYIVWECQRMDGTEELTLKDLQIKTAHIAFNPPQGVNFRIYDMLPNNENTDYQIIKEYGRGTVEIVQYPQRKNNYSMKIKIDDGPYPSYDYYRFYLVSYL